MKTKTLPILMISTTLICLGCTSGLEPPKYTLIEVGKESNTIAQEARPIKGGWEFQFPKPFAIQKVVVYHDGSLTGLAFYAKTERRWEQVKSVSVDAKSPSDITLNVMTDAIRVMTMPAQSGRITSCQFFTGKPQRTFSIPLEKPPFIK